MLLGKKGTPPATWGAADIETRKLYSQEMSTRFPELKLCDLDWKAEQIATDNYPSWHYTWDSKMGHQDIKIEKDNSHAAGSGSQTKRLRGESMTIHLKRTKVKDVDDISVSLDIIAWILSGISNLLLYDRLSRARHIWSHLHL